MGRYNKATAAAIAGAAATVVGAAFGLDVEIVGAIQTLLTAGLVWFIPNRPETPAEV